MTNTLAYLNTSFIMLTLVIITFTISQMKTFIKNKIFVNKTN
jgi:hypothetical protein